MSQQQTEHLFLHGTCPFWLAAPATACPIKKLIFERLWDTLPLLGDPWWNITNLISHLYSTDHGQWCSAGHSPTVHHSSLHPSISLFTVDDDVHASSTAMVSPGHADISISTCTPVSHDSKASKPQTHFLVIVKIWYIRATGNGQGCGNAAAEAAEWNQSVSLHRVKTWPQLMCCALV